MLSTLWNKASTYWKNNNKSLRMDGEGEVGREAEDSVRYYYDTMSYVITKAERHPLAETKPAPTKTKEGTAVARSIQDQQATSDSAAADNGAASMKEEDDDRLAHLLLQMTKQSSSMTAKESSMTSITAMTTEDPVLSITKGGVTTPFPWKLHDLLEDMEKHETQSVVSWLPHGRSFMVHKSKEFSQGIMRRYFTGTRYASFQRQLNLYGFSRTSRGIDKGSYYHANFVRGQRNLCRGMVRQKIKGTKVRRASSAETEEPNFYLPEYKISSQLTDYVSEPPPKSVQPSRMVLLENLPLSATPDDISACLYHQYSLNVLSCNIEHGNNPKAGWCYAGGGMRTLTCYAHIDLPNPGESNRCVSLAKTCLLEYRGRILRASMEANNFHKTSQPTDVSEPPPPEQAVHPQVSNNTGNADLGGKDDEASMARLLQHFQQNQQHQPKEEQPVKVAHQADHEAAQMMLLLQSTSSPESSEASQEIQPENEQRRPAICSSSAIAVPTPTLPVPAPVAANDKQARLKEESNSSFAPQHHPRALFQPSLVQPLQPPARAVSPPASTSGAIQSSPASSMETKNLVSNDNKKKREEESEYWTHLPNGNKKKRFREEQSESWTQRLAEVKWFFKEHGHCCIPHVYPQNQELAFWAKRQRYQYTLYTRNGSTKTGKKSSLSRERIQALDDIGFCWTLQKTAWMDRYEELIKYSKENDGKTSVPTHYDKNRRLAVWVKVQRRQYKLWERGEKSTMNDRRVTLLEAIGFEWQASEIRRQRPKVTV